MKSKNSRLPVKLAIGSVVLLIAIGAVFYHYHDGLRWVDSFYFTTMTVMTIGYGDYRPANDISKIFTTIYTLVSVPTLLFYLGWIVDARLSHRLEAAEVFADSQK
jgi:hypothetical protein